MRGKVRRAILLAGGGGTRLYPATKNNNKQLLPIYNKPLIYYPLSTIMRLGVREVLLITSPRDEAGFRELLGDGSQLGMHIQYSLQMQPLGIADGIRIGSEFVGADPFVLMLGDNLFLGADDSLARGLEQFSGATIFAIPVSNPQQFGVVEFDKTHRAISIEEKPTKPKSNYAVTGLYVYDREAVAIAQTLRPSARGELEITALNNEYLRRGMLQTMLLPSEAVWLDTGSPAGMLDAAQTIAELETREGKLVGCIEEVAMQMGFIGCSEADSLISGMPKCPYRDYLEKVLETMVRC